MTLHSNQEINILKDVIASAITQRGKHYVQIFALSIRFEDDDTAAEKDAKCFQDLLRLMGLSKASELVIESTDKIWIKTVQAKLYKLQEAPSRVDGRTLAIIHYAGHGSVDAAGDLFFCPFLGSNQSLYYERTFGLLQDEAIFPTTDIIMILDSCFSGRATRGILPVQRSLEVLAAVGATQTAFGNDTSRIRGQNITFTNKLVTAVSRRISRGESSVAFADVVSELVKDAHSTRRPEYRLVLGKAGVRIPLSGPRRSIPPYTHPSRQSATSDSSSFTSLSQSHEHFAVIRVYLKDADPTSADVKTLLEWLRSLHPSLGLELMGAFQGNSTNMLLRVPWSLWAQLNGNPAVSLVFETHGGNLLPGLFHRSQEGQHPQQASSLISKENLPPRRSFDKWYVVHCDPYRP